jgi:hypothetical protein
MKAARFIALAIAIVVASAGAKEMEKLLRRAWIPSAERPQGEIRLVERSGEPVIEVVLHTRVLRHVVARIREKEMTNWPDGQPGAEARRSYVEAFEESAADVLRAHAPTPGAKGQASTSAKVALLIEIGGGESGGFAVFSEPEVIESKDGLEIKKVRRLRQIALPGPYAKRNIELILADNFHDRPGT